MNSGYAVDGGERREAIGKAYFTGAPDVGQLKVSFFGPFYGGYNIISLDRQDYGWAMVCGPSTSYLWILAREPQLPPEVLERLVATARDLGFDTSQLIFTPQ